MGAAMFAANTIASASNSASADMGSAFSALRVFPKTGSIDILVLFFTGSPSVQTESVQTTAPLANLLADRGRCVNT
jgi:hypothetical protein